MVKAYHELRDPIHNFIRLDSHERTVLNSTPFQRLRHIHQLALSSLIYPGATHKRFEHSLGVMELAGRVYDVVVYHLGDNMKDLFPEAQTEDELVYWRRAIRMAALCHDLGHLPFSHAAEEALLPEGWSHERLTQDIILSEEMLEIWQRMRPPLNPDDIVKLAIGKKHARDIQFTDWEAILSEIIVGDAFGVDRMDYLLRDSYHAGVAYGKFDHYRLIDTLRILPSPPTPESPESRSSKEPALGVMEGGLHSSEALLLARYFMFTQVYFHPVRRIYDIHLKDFLLEWLPDGKMPTEIKELIKVTDNEVYSAILMASRDQSYAGHLHAKRIVCRGHYKVLYQPAPDDKKVNPDAAKAVYDATCIKYNNTSVRYDCVAPKSGAPDFPVLMRDGRVVSSVALSQALAKLPTIGIEYVFIDRAHCKEATGWLRESLQEVIRPQDGEDA